MFNHVTIGSDDIPASRAFYDAALGALGIGPGVMDGLGRAIYVSDGAFLVVTRPLNGGPATAGNGVTFAFRAATPEAANAWHAAGLAAGGSACEDPPGYRQTDYGLIYGAYLRDPAGNKLCAVVAPVGLADGPK